MDRLQKRKNREKFKLFIFFLAIALIIVSVIFFFNKSISKKNRSIEASKVINEKTINDKEKETTEEKPTEIITTTNTNNKNEEEIKEQEYLILVNKTHPVDENFAPSDLISVKYTVDGVGNEETKKLSKVAARAFENLVEGAYEDGVQIKMRTGYRSYSYQTTLYNSYVKNHGVEEADTFSARPGKSEHQTGLALDVTGKTSNWDLTFQFGDTPEGKWILDHAHEYGFILRFNDGPTDQSEVGPITKYLYEPWHIRYVGIENAKKIWEQSITLEEYLDILD